MLFLFGASIKYVRTKKGGAEVQKSANLVDKQYCDCADKGGRN